MTDALPVFERLQSISEARKAFTQVENSSRLKKALKVRGQKMEYYATGEKVFYKFGSDPRWHGPGDIEDENDTGSEGEENEVESLELEERVEEFNTTGTLSRVENANEFRQIRRKFLSFPFQAIECYLANWFENEVNKKICRTGAGHPRKGEKDRRKKRKWGLD